MKEQIRQNRGLLMLLAVFLVICLAAGLNTKSVHAASKAPALSIGNQGVIFTDQAETSIIKLTNLPKDVISVKWSVDNKKIAYLQEYMEDDDIDDEKPIHTKAYVHTKKAGKAVVSAKITYKTGETTKETYTAKKTIQVKSPALKSVKVGKIKAARGYYASDGKVNYRMEQNHKGKLKVTPKKGWKIVSITFKDGKSKKKVKNGSVINGKKIKSFVDIKLVDTKTKSIVYNAKLVILKYYVWKITYGKMKKNTAFSYDHQPEGGSDGYEGPAVYKYKKNAKKSDYFSFKSCKDLAQKLGGKVKGNVITVKKTCIQRVEMKWINKGAGCKIERTRP